MALLIARKIRYSQLASSYIVLKELILNLGSKTYLKTGIPIFSLKLSLIPQYAQQFVWQEFKKKKKIEFFRYL